MSKEMVVHPEHYRLNINLEVMDVINVIVKDLQGKNAFYVGNVVKYILRAEKKNKLEDYRKALYYLSFLENFFSPKINNFTLSVLDSVLMSIQNEDLGKCTQRVFEHKFEIAYKILENYIKEKENEQTAKTKTEKI